MDTARDTLRQRVGTTIRTFTLESDAVLVRESQQFVRRSRYRVPYATLSTEPIEATAHSRLLLGLTVVSLLLSALIVVADSFGGRTWGVTAVLMYGGFALIFGFLYVSSRRRILIVPASDRSLVFALNRPSAGEFEAFLAELAIRRAASRHHYRADASGGSAADELQKLVWLKDQNAITPDEFDRLKRRVIGAEA